MAMTAPKSSGADIEPLKEGTYPMVLIWLASIGVHRFEYKGTKKVQPKLVLGFEVPGETRVFDEDKGEETVTRTAELTFSTHRKSTLTVNFLKPWVGSTVDFDSYDLTQLAGCAGLGTIEHKPRRNGGVWEEVSGITRLPQGLQCPPRTRDLIVVEHLNPNGEDGIAFNQEGINALPVFIRRKIAESDEWTTNRLWEYIELPDDEDNYTAQKKQAPRSAAGPPASPAAPAPAPGDDVDLGEEEDDDIPF